MHALLISKALAVAARVTAVINSVFQHRSGGTTGVHTFSATLMEEARLPQTGSAPCRYTYDVRRTYKDRGAMAPWPCPLRFPEVADVRPEVPALLSLAPFNELSESALQHFSHPHAAAVFPKDTFAFACIVQHHVSISPRMLRAS